MKILPSLVPPLATVLSAFTFAACSSTAAVTPNAAGSFMQASRSATTFATQPAPPATNALLFVSAGRQNLIQIYNANPPNALVGQITDGLVGPNAQAVDAAGNLFVANADGGSVTVYPPGATKPSITYTKGLTNPLTPVVGRDGTLYVSNFNNDGSGEVLEYAPHQLNPSFKIPLAAGAIGLALDAKNNLYVSVEQASGRILKFAPKSTKGKDLGITLGFAGRLAIDGSGNLIACDQTAPAVDIFPPGATKPSKQITKGFVDPFAVALGHHLERLYVADGAGNTVLVYSYPELKVLNVIHRTSAAFGLSVNPPAPL